MLTQLGSPARTTVKRVDSEEDPATVGSGIAAIRNLEKRVQEVECGEMIAYVNELIFRDSGSFMAGELHNNLDYWQEIAERSPSDKQLEILAWIRDKVSVSHIFSILKKFGERVL